MSKLGLVATPMILMHPGDRLKPPGVGQKPRRWTGDFGWLCSRSCAQRGLAPSSGGTYIAALYTSGAERSGQDLWTGGSCQQEALEQRMLG